MGLISRIKSLVTKGEGDVTSGPYFLPISGGWLPTDVGNTLNWWQRGFDIQPLTSPTALVEACISAYAQTIAMCPGTHWQADPDGGRTRVTTSALSRILKQPNSYQTTTDFLLNTVRHVYAEGNAYVLALRNSRFEIAELHLMSPRASAAHIAYDGSIFYTMNGNTIVDAMFGGKLALVPARDVMHIRLNTHPHDPLRGISPIVAAALDIAATSAIMRQQLDFYLNQARPSMALSTDLVLDAAQVQALRDRWNEQVKSLNNGGFPILTGGLKPLPMAVTSEDAQLAEIMKMTDQHIALAFRIPQQILGIASGTQGATSALMEQWLNQSLGFAITHVEDAFTKMFGLSGYPDNYCEFDSEVLLRSNFKDRIEGLARAVQGGIMSPNEARNKEFMPKVEFGDEPRVQQQVVPLSAASQIQAAPPSPGAPPSAPVATKEARNGTRISATDKLRFEHLVERRVSRPD